MVNNLLAGGGFDDAGDITDNSPDNWRAGASATLSSESSAGKTGNCLLITEAGATDPYAYQTATTVIGKLYQFTMYLKAGTEATYNVGLGSGGATSTQYIDTTAEAAANWTDSVVTLVFEATSVTTTLTIWQKASSGAGTTLRADSVTLYEVTPGCVAADALAMDGWTKEDNTQCLLYRQHSDGNTESVSKLGSFYSVKCVASASTYFCTPDSTLRDNPDWYSRFAGRTMTLGCWVKGATASDVNLSIYDGTHRESSANVGTGWEWLEVTYACPGTITIFQICVIVSTAGTHYVSQPMLVFGSSIGEGNYTRPQGEIVWTEKAINSTVFDASGKSDVTTTALNLEADSNGMIPKGARATCFTGYLRDSGSAGVTDGVYFSLNQSSTKASTYMSCAGTTDNTVNRYGTIWVDCDSDGDLVYAINASGSGTLDPSVTYIAVQLR